MPSIILGAKFYT